jgi:general secretion pathway protein G
MSIRMLERLREVRRNESGFTLIELLIVIVILGVLAGLVVFGVQAFSKDGRYTACEADKKSVQVASEAFKAKSSTTSPPSGIPQLVTDGYLKEAPKAIPGQAAVVLDTSGNATGCTAP